MGDQLLTGLTPLTRTLRAHPTISLSSSQLLQENGMGDGVK